MPHNSPVMPLTDTAAPVPFIVHGLLDQRPGHRNQVLGLLEGLSRRGNVKGMAVQARTIELPSRVRGWRGLVASPADWSLPGEAPDLLIGAGHGTHLPLLRGARAFGCVSVVLMKPSLPTWCFHACLIPDSHSLCHCPDNVMMTQGAVNRMVSRPDVRNAGSGLLLIGGPSRHYEWETEAVVRTVRSLLQQTGGPVRQWTAATSRRTPQTLVEQLRRLGGTVFTPDDVGRDWLPEQMQRSEFVAATPDSYSMVYEALTAGCRLALLDLLAQEKSRVAAAMARLVKQKHAAVVPADGAIPWCPPCPAYAEADRCADSLLDRFGPSYRNLASSARQSPHGHRDAA